MGMMIVCGYGTAGKAAVSRLEKETSNIVIIDKDEKALAGSAHTSISGDATEEATLKQAGIERASAMIVTAGSDVLNSFVILAAKAINPKISVYTVAERMENIDKLYRAGADYVVQESVIGARELVDGALGYSSGDSRVYLGNGSELHAIKAGKAGRCGDISKDSGTNILGIRKGNKWVPNPGPGVSFSKGDVLYISGTQREIEILKRLVSAL